MFGAANTSSAPSSGGLFGAFKPQPSGNLFGSTSASSGTLFGASNNNNNNNSGGTPQAGSNLFGSTAANPGPQPGTNLFGAPATNSTPQTASTLFGSAATNPAPQSGGSLFGSTATSSAPPGGSLFGATTSAPQGGSSLFGATTSAPQGGSSLFGATTSAPQGGGNLFGSTTNSNPQSGGSLFGTATTSTPQSGGNLFGSTTTSAPQNSGNLFGTTTTSTPQSGGSLFGSTAPANSTPSTGWFGASNQTTLGQPGTTNQFGNNQNAPAGSLFGSTNQNQTTSGTSNLFSNSQIFGNSLNNKSSSVPATPVTSGINNGVSQSNPVFTRTTRFNDLPDDAKKQLEMLDAMIQTQCRHSDALKAMQLGTEITEGTSLLRQVTSEMHATSASVTTSSNLLDSVRQAIDGDVAGLLKLATIVDAHLTQRLAVGAHNPSESLPNPIKFQYEFFSQKCAEMEDRVKRYRQTIEFVELQLKGLFDRPSPASIVPALKAQYSTFIALADKVAQLNTSIISLKEDYREIWRHQTGSVRDPFAEVDRVFGVGQGSSLTNFQTC